MNTPQKNLNTVIKCILRNLFKYSVKIRYLYSIYNLFKYCQDLIISYLRMDFFKIKFKLSFYLQLNFRLTVTHAASNI